MANTPAQEDLKALDQTRQRLAQFKLNLGSLQDRVYKGQPLPDWPSLQMSATILAGNIQAITAQLAKHADLFERTVAYPSPNFDGRAGEYALREIVRKKHEIPIEHWIEEGRSARTGVSDRVEKEDEGLRSWAIDWFAQRALRYAQEEDGDDYTVEERENGIENVNTGLRRSLDESESEDDDEMEDVVGTAAVPTPANQSTGQLFGEVKPKDPNAKPRSMADILSFSTSGEIRAPPVVRPGGIRR